MKKYILPLIPCLITIYFLVSCSDNVQKTTLDDVLLIDDSLVLLKSTNQRFTGTIHDLQKRYSAWVTNGIIDSSLTTKYGRTTILKSLPNNKTSEIRYKEQNHFGVELIRTKAGHIKEIHFLEGAPHKRKMSLELVKITIQYHPNCAATLSWRNISPYPIKDCSIKLKYSFVDESTGKELYNSFEYLSHSSDAEFIPKTIRDIEFNSFTAYYKLHYKVRLNIYLYIGSGWDDVLIDQIYINPNGRNKIFNILYP